jgi:hypothetical protein
MEDPPLLVGAVNVMVAEPEVELDAASEVGAPGTVAGVTADDAVDRSEVNNAFVAVALNV